MSLLSAVLQEAKNTSTEEDKKIFPKLKDLTERVQLLSWALQQNIIDTHVNYTVTKSLEQLNYKNRRGSIISDYIKYKEIIKSYEESKHDNEEFKIITEKLFKSYSTFEKLCVVAEAKRILAQANHYFDRYNFQEAILTVNNLKKDLNSFKFEGNMAKALSNVIAQAENQLALYTAHVSIEWEDIFTWSEKKGLKYLTYSLSIQQSDPMLIKNILKTLYVSERLNAELALFSHFFINQLLHNVIKYNCDIFTEDHIGAIVFNIKNDLNDTKKPTYHAIFNNLIAIFEFLCSTLGSHLEGEETFIEVFAASIREKFFNKIIEDCIRINLPSCDSSYETYKNIVVELDAFNKFLIDLKFVCIEKSPLNKYLDDTECVLYNKKCEKLLADVRDVLAESLSCGTLEVGATTDNGTDSIINVKENIVWDLDKPIFLPKCMISWNVKKIMSMITDHLEESAKLPEIYYKQLVAYIKDIAVLYQCIVPQKFKVNLECCPSDIALFFNNCFYLAHGLIGPPWSNILPRPLADHLILVLLECIQDLRTLGLEKISLYLQTQKNAIIQNIESQETLWTQETYEQLDCAINNATTLMKDLKASWSNVLPTKMYEMSMCTLIQALCQAILERMFGNTKPVDERLVYMLASRIEDTVADIFTLFEVPVQFEDNVVSWNKLTKLPQLLKAQLLELSELWNKNKEEFKCFTCEEVRQIIKMRFPDDRFRLRTLKEIQ